MYVDYGGDAYAGMGIKAMKSFARPRGMERCERSPVVSLLIFSSSLFFYTRYSVRCFRKIFSLIRSTSAFLLILLDVFFQFLIGIFQTDFQWDYSFACWQV